MTHTTDFTTEELATMARALAHRADALEEQATKEAREHGTRETRLQALRDLSAESRALSRKVRDIIVGG